MLKKSLSPLRGLFLTLLINLGLTPQAIFLTPLRGFLSSTETGQSYREWRVYSGDSAGTKYSALDQINRSNVHKLRAAWIYRSGERLEDPALTIECNPIIVDGLLYITTPSLRAVALDAATGRKVWEFDPWHGRRARGVNRGVTYWSDGTDRRIFYAAGSYVYALDAQTGRTVEAFGDHGKIDLRAGLDRDVSPLSVTATTPGIVYKDLLVMGSAVGEGPSPGAPGHIRAYDARTGKRRWIFHTIPHPGEPGHETWPADAWKTIGGANSWGGFTLDEKRGLVFCGTGSASYDHYGGNRIGQNLFANCILALNAESGKLVWYFQVVHHDLWDYDIACQPNLVTLRQGNRFVDAVAQPTKMGHLFVLDRETGKPLFPVEERAVPQSTLPGEQTWPTQPFPLKPPAYAQQRFTEAEVTDVSSDSREYALKQLQDMRQGDIFLPPGLTASVVLPQFNGGTDWGGAAFDPETRTLYVNTSNEAEWISMAPAREREKISAWQFGQRLYRAMCTDCHETDDSSAPNTPAWARLAGISERLSKKEALFILDEGRGQMPSYKTLSEVEKRSLVAFLFGEGKDEQVEAHISWAKEIPYVATGHREFHGPNGLPVNKRPWGTVSAIDLDQGEIAWQVPLGTYPQLEAKGHAPTGTFNMGGPVVTAGGLVFIGAAMDERFRAIDKESGKVLWEYQMDAGGYATPATYEINGKQYVVIAAGGGGKPGTKPGDAYYCFALPPE